MPSHMLKLVLVGDVGVGKTSLIRRVFFNEFSDDVESTVGASFVSRTFGDVRLDVWDTAGQERYQALLPMYVRNADVAWVVTDRQRDLRYWTELILEQRGSACHIITVQSKMDCGQARLPMTDCFTSAKNDVGCADLLRLTLATNRPVDRQPPNRRLRCTGESGAWSTCC